MLNRQKRMWVDGTVHSGYHPHLPKKTLMLPSLDTIARKFADPVNAPARAASQRTFTVVPTCDAWLSCLDECLAFDAANDSASISSVPHREAARLISCSQHGAGAWLSRLPDPSIFGSVCHSAKYRTAIERRCGLEVSALKPALAWREAQGEAVTLHDRLGDAAINSANHTRRHNAGLQALYLAVSAAAVCEVKLGDKGDGTRGGRETAAKKYSHLNATHIPDIIAGRTLWEFKALTPFKPKPALGNGSNANGGAPSTADGWFIAFGGTLEDITRETRGLLQIGKEGDDAFDRTTGEGYVAPVDGDYADAIRKKIPMILFTCETSGAISPEGHAALGHLARQVRRPGHRDGTKYGENRGSPKGPNGFRAHHEAEISAAVVFADAETLLTYADSTTGA